MSYYSNQIEQEKMDSLIPNQLTLESPLHTDQFSKINPEADSLIETHLTKPQQRPGTEANKQGQNQWEIEIENFRNENEYLRKTNIEANQKIQQLQNLDLLYQRETALLNSEIERLLTENSDLSQIIEQSKKYQRDLGIRFDTNSHQLNTCKQQYEVQIQQFKEKCAQLEYKITFQSERREKEKKSSDEQTTTLLLKLKQSQSDKNKLKLQINAFNNQIKSMEEVTNKLKEKVHQQKQRFKEDEKQWLKCRHEWNVAKSQYEEEILQLVDSNQTLNNSISDLIRKYTDLEEKTKEDDTMKIDKNLLELQVEELKKQLENYEEEFAYAARKMEEFEGKINELESEKEQLEDKLANQQKLQDINESQELISQIDSIESQLKELKQQFVKLSPTEKYQKLIESQVDFADIKSQLGGLASNPAVRRLMSAFQQNQQTISELTKQLQTTSKTQQQLQIYKQMQDLIEDVVSELHEQKRSRRILEQTMLHFQAEINSYRNSSYEQVHSIPSRLSLVPFQKPKKYDDFKEMTFKKNNSFQIRRSQSSNLIKNRRQLRRQKIGEESHPHLSLYLPETKTLREILSNYVSKQALLKIMYRVTQETMALIEHQQVNITSDKIIIAGYQSLSPSKIDIIIQNLTQPSMFYMSPEMINGQIFCQKSAVWSLGVLFDEMIHRNHFFTNKQQISDPKYKYVFKSFTFRELKPLISNCLSKDPKFRPELGEILENLEEIELNTY